MDAIAATWRRALARGRLRPTSRCARAVAGLDHRLDERARAGASSRDYGIAPPQRRPATSARPVGLTLVGALPAVRHARHPRGQPVRLDRVQVAVGVPVLPRAVRPLQGDLMRRRTPTPRVFHPLRGRRGRAADRRRGRDHVRRARRAARRLRVHRTASTSPCAPSGRRRGAPHYSICAPRPASGVLRIGVKRLPGGGVLRARARAARGRRRARRDDAGRPVLHRGSTRPNAKHYVARRGRLGHHAGALDRRDARSRPSRQLAVTLVYGNRTHRTVMFLEELARPQGPLPRPVPPDARALPRAAGRRAALRPARRGAAAPDPRRAGAGRRRRRVVPVRAVRRWSIELRETLLERAASTRHRVHTELFHVEPGAARVRSTDSRAAPRARRRGDDHARRPGSTFSCGPTTSRGPRRRAAGALRRCRSPARAASAAPAAPSSSRARSRWTRTTRSSPRRSRRATCSPASATPRPSPSASLTTRVGGPGQVP